MSTLFFLDKTNVIFPSVDMALKDPNGLLAAGGNLNVDTLLKAYKQGIFPWFNENEPILWWSPSPRMVLKPNELHISHTLHKMLKKDIYSTTMNQQFSNVIHACANTRKEQGSWITKPMLAAYIEMHYQGYAQSVEVVRDKKLVGGLYGIAIGKMFFGESMFSLEPSTSKIALVALVKNLLSQGYQLIDCQQHTAYLESMGASLIQREEFIKYLACYCQ